MNRKAKTTAPGADGSYFTRRMFRRQYLPAMISAITLSASDIADAVVVGNSLGLKGLAAMAFALPIFMIYNVIMHSFGLGGSIRYSVQMARGEEKNAVSDFQGVMYSLLGLGLFIALAGNLLIDPLTQLLGADPGQITLFDMTGTYVQILLMAAPLFFLAYGLGYYMRNADMEKEASICASAGNICDVVLNVVLVLICKKGVWGAGIATLSGVLLTTVMEVILLHVRKTPLKFFPLKISFHGVWRSFRMGFSSSVSHAYSLVYILICNNLLMRMSGERIVAVFDVVQNISYIFGYLYGAVSQAAQPILSTYQGEYNFLGCRALQRLELKTALAAGMTAALIVGIIAPQVCIFFGITEAADIALGAWALRLFCLSTLLGGVNALLAEYYLARGRELPAFLSTTLRRAAVLIPVAILFSFFGEKFFWLLYPVTEMIALAVFLIYLWRTRGKGSTIDPDRIYRILLRQLEDIGEATEEIREFCEKWEASMKQQYFVQMTVEEVCSAIIANGFGKGRDERGMIQITLVAGEDGIITLHVRDSAVEFNPFGMDKADIKNDVDNLDFNAVGMDVIKQRSREFYYRRYQGFNTMVVKI